MASASNASPAAASSPWLFGPVWDLILGCGGFYFLIVAASSFAGAQIRALEPESFFPLLVILFLSPHYGATILRVYEKRKDRKAYAIFAVYITLALAALFAVGLYSVWVASLLVTVYLTWNPWHYAGQNYGLSVMFLRRAGVPIDGWLKQTIYASFVLSIVFTFIVMHGLNFGANYGVSTASDDVVHFMSLDLPRSFTGVVLPFVGLAYVGTLVAAWVGLSRRARIASLLPVAGLMAMQASWFSVPMALHFYNLRTGLEPLDADFRTHYFAWIAASHAIQYLWVTTYYARQSPDWRGFGTYWLKILAVGQAVASVPLIVFGPGALGTMSYEGGLFVLVLAVMNLHHFMLDGAIWKLRSGPVARILLRKGDEAGVVATADAASSPWPRRLAWSAALFGLTVGVYDYWVRWIDVPNLLRRGENVTASRHLDRVGWMGTDSERRRFQMAGFMLRSGDKDHAVAELRRSAELRPSIEAYVAIGAILTEEGDLEGALGAYTQALQLEPDRLGLLHHAGETLLRMGRPEEARKLLVRAVRADPDHIPSRQALKRANEAIASKGTDSQEAS